jgi:hypothetical protein
MSTTAGFAGRPDSAWRDAVRLWELGRVRRAFDVDGSDQPSHQSRRERSPRSHPRPHAHNRFVWRMIAWHQTSGCGWEGSRISGSDTLTSMVGGTSVGRFGRAAVFSFQGNKVPAACEGGVIATTDSELAGRGRLMRNSDSPVVARLPRCLLTPTFFSSRPPDVASLRYRVVAVTARITSSTRVSFRTYPGRASSTTQRDERQTHYAVAEVDDP